MPKTIFYLLWILTVVAVGLAVWGLGGSDLRKQIRERERQIDSLEKEAENLEKRAEELERQRLDADAKLEEAEKQLAAREDEYNLEIGRLDETIAKLEAERDRNRRKYEELYASIDKKQSDELATEIEGKLRELAPKYEGAEFALFPRSVFEDETFRANRPAAEGFLFSLLKREELSLENENFESEVAALEAKTRETKALLEETNGTWILCKEARGRCLEQLAVEQEIGEKLSRALGLSRENFDDLDRALKRANRKRWLQTLGGVAAGFVVGAAID